MVRLHPLGPQTPERQAIAGGHGYFWPGWVLGGSGIRVALYAWEVYGRRPIVEDDIAREMRRHPGGA